MALRVLELFETVQFYRKYGMATKEGLVVDCKAVGLGESGDVVATGMDVIPLILLELLLLLNLKPIPSVLCGKQVLKISPY